MTTITVIFGIVAVGTWTWIIGDIFDWWRRMSTRRRNRRNI